MSKLTTEDNKLKKTKTSNYLNNNKTNFSNNIKNDSLSKGSNNSSTSINNNLNRSLQKENKKKKLYHEKSKQHPKCSSCTNKQANIVYKNKSALSNYILMNLITKKNYYHPNLKLLGNSRYKHCSPLLYVEDQKNNMSNESYGLIPIPLEKFKNKDKNDEEKEDKKRLYELQRSIVMSRRFQYNKDKNKWKNYEDERKENDIFKKIILIQKCWKNYLNKNSTNRKIEEFAKKIKNINNKNVFSQLKNLILKKTILNSIYYISKIKHNNFNDKIKRIQNDFRVFLKQVKFRKKFKIIKNLNTKCYISKNCYKYSFRYINESIKKIQNNYRIYKNRNKENNNQNYNAINNNSIKNNLTNKNEVSDDKNINNKYDDDNDNINSYKNAIINSSERNELINSKDDKNIKNNNGNIMLIKNKNNESDYYNYNYSEIEKNLNKKNNKNKIEKKNINNGKNANLMKNNNNCHNTTINKNKSEKKDKIDYNILNDIISFQNVNKNNNDNINKNNKKIIKFINLINRHFLSYICNKIKYYINQPIFIKPKIMIYFMTKENIVKKQNQQYNNLKDNKIQKLEIEINNNSDYIEKIYRKPIINGRSFKYQYYFSNNPYSYMNVSYISKIIIKNNDIYSQIYNYYQNINNINNAKKPIQILKELKNNNENLESYISSRRNSNTSKRNSRLSLSHLSERKRLSKFFINNKNIIQIAKNYSNGYFISKKIFNYPKKDIIKIQKNLRKMTLTKNKIFKRPSYTYVDKKNLTNIDNESKNFDTENVKAMIIVNNNKKKPTKDEDMLDFSNSYKNSKNEFEGKKILNINNLEKINKRENIFDDYLNNNINLEKDNNNEESISDSAIIAKIKLNYDSSSDKENNNEENNFIIKQDNNSKDIFCITKIRRINSMKYINKIQRAYKYHLYLKNNKNNFTNINIIAYQKPKNNYCYCSIDRLIETKTDRFMFIYNPKIKYLIFILNLFITKNVQDYTFKVIKNKNKNVDKNKNYFAFPFYIQTIKRVINYLKKKKNENINKKVFLFFNEIFNLNNSNDNNNRAKSILSKLCFLSKKDSSQLINYNLFTGYEENELINFLCDFSEFDKNLNNEEFIIERLKRTKLNNTNIFTLIKLIDFEYANLVKGEYCFKCYNYENSCKCYAYINKNKDELNHKYNEDINMEEDYEMSDSELNDDEEIKTNRKINCFCYNTNSDNKENILIIETKLNENKSKKIIDIIIPKENTLN